MLTSDPAPEEHPECRYCASFLAPESSSQASLFNTPVIESANFVVVPTLGHFVPGWLLIIPRLHYPCIGALDSNLRSELISVKKESEELLMSMYGLIIKFEHGPCSTGIAGACVDHAHLHLVPASIGLQSELASRFAGRRIQDFSDLTTAYHDARSYLFFEDAKGLKTIYDIELLPSQFMRMLLARELGMPERYDWRVYDGTAELKSFFRDLKKHRSERWKSEFSRR